MTRTSTTSSSSPTPSLSPTPSWLFWAVPIAAAALLGSGACSDNGGGTTSPTTTETTGGSGGAGGAGGSGGSVTFETARELFNQVVLPGLLEECGACHDLAGPADSPFLAGPDPYTSVTSWPGIVVKDPAKSILVVRPSEASHAAGKAPSISDGLKAKCLQWLTMEADNLPDVAGAPLYSVDPFKPITGGALNTIYLEGVDPSLQYASISFHAEELGDSLLQIDNLQVHPAFGQSIHIIHPLFTVYPANGPATPDPIDSFAGVNEIFSPDAIDVALGTGEILLTNWQKDAYLGITFDLLVDEGGGDPAIPCKDVQTFKEQVVPQVQACADSCHGGANPQAKATMDLSMLGADPPDAACAQVRIRTTPGNPATSQIVIVTDPAQPAVHMYKFMGDKAKHQAFKDAVSPWITLETQ